MIVSERLVKILVAMSVLLACGCSRLPDLNRMQNNMDTMVHYMGVMASGMPVMVNSTARMANTAERMERKSDGLLADLQKKGGDVERTVQNYSQAFIDNDRAAIKNLQGIKMELGDLKQALRQVPATPDTHDQTRINASFQSRLGDIEARLAAISSKLDKLGQSPPPK